MGAWALFMFHQGGGVVVSTVVGCIKAVEVYQSGSVSRSAYQGGMTAGQAGCNE